MDEKKCNQAGMLAAEDELKGILNNLTPHNINEISEQVIAVNIDSIVTLSVLVSQIVENALLEPTLCEVYATLCYRLQPELPDFIRDNKKITFRILLLNKCQEEFERGEIEQEQEETNKVDEGERRRVLGNIRLIGELYKKRIMTERIIHECFKKFLIEENVEVLCVLMSVTGQMIDHPKAKEYMDLYCERMRLLSNNVNLSSRLRFMLKDLIDLRKNKWRRRSYDAQPDSIVSATEVSVKKYSRVQRFPLKLAEKCTHLPERFEIDADKAEEFMSVNASYNVPQANPRQLEADLDDPLGELFSCLENLQNYVRERFDHIDTSIASLDYRMRRLECCHHDA